MNKRLPEEIFSIVKKLDKAEIKAFETYSIRKKPEDGKEHKYIKLFKLYLKQVGELEFVEGNILKEAKNISGSIDDLNQKLHGEILKFLGLALKEKQTDETERTISNLLDISIALHEKRLYSLSARNFLKAIRLLQQEQDPQLKENLLYLSLKAYSWVFIIKFKGKLTEEESAEFDEFNKFMQPFSQIARNAYSALTQSGRENALQDESFDRATFYSLLNIYFREKQVFESNFTQRGNHDLFPIADMLKGEYKKYGNSDKIAEKAENSIIDAESFYFQLERLYRAVVANDRVNFDQAFNSIRSRLFPGFSLVEFNADLLLYVYRQLFELKTLFTLQNNQPPFDTHDLRELETISRTKMHLFHNSEISDFSLRIELNSFVVLFMERKYEDLLKGINKFEKHTKKELLKEYFIDIKLMAIICRLQTGGAADEELDTRIDYYENYTKKYPTSEFHKKFDGFIRAFISASVGDRKKVCEKYLAKLEKSKETFNHFHALYLHWVKGNL